MADAHELPRRGKPVHHQDQAIDEGVGFARAEPVQGALRGRRIEQRPKRLDLFAFEDAELARQAPRQIGQQFAQRQDSDDRVEIFDGARRADLDRKPAARFLVAVDFGDGVADAPDRAIMQRADQLIGTVAVVGKQGAIDVLAERLHLRGDKVAADPSPDRLKRDARDAADALVVGAAVDQKRLERREEHARRIADARHLLGLGPDGAAEFLQDQIIAGALLATQ